MTDSPVLLSTSLGPTAAIVTEPAGTPRGTLVVLPGDGPPGRSGINAVWTRMARELAGLGLLVVRFDYADEGDGTMIRGDSLPEARHKSRVDLVLLRELVAWLRERCGVDDLLLIGDCHGGRIAIDFAGEDPRVTGVFLSVPYVRKSWVELTARRRPAGRLRRMLGRIDPGEFHESVIEALPVMLAKGPVWMLTGEGDGDETLQLQRLFRSRRRRNIEVEVVQGKAIHPVSGPDVEREVSQRLLRRIARALDERDAERLAHASAAGAAVGSAPAT